LGDACASGGQREDGRGLCPRFAHAFEADAEHAIFDLALDPTNWTGGFALQTLAMGDALTQLDIILPDARRDVVLDLLQSAARGGLAGQAELAADAAAQSEVTQ